MSTRVTCLLIPITRLGVPKMWTPLVLFGHVGPSCCSKDGLGGWILGWLFPVRCSRGHVWGTPCKPEWINLKGTVLVQHFKAVGFSRQMLQRQGNDGLVMVSSRLRTLTDSWEFMFCVQAVCALLEQYSRNKHTSTEECHSAVLYYAL